VEPSDQRSKKDTYDLYVVPKVIKRLRMEGDDAWENDLDEGPEASLEVLKDLTGKIRQALEKSGGLIG
jgi:hypothetical protein